MIEGAGSLDLVTIKGDQADIKILRDGLAKPVAQVGNTAWVAEGQLSFLLDGRAYARRA